MAPLILIGLPGCGAGGLWLIHWNNLFARLMREYRVVCCYGMGANVYKVRNDCMPAWESLPEMPEYMLWIDSDNLPTYAMFQALRTALEQNPSLDMVAGWAWTQDAMGNQKPKISAGWRHNGKPTNIPYESILHWTAENKLIPVAWTGLCFALIRSESLKLLGQEPFMPIPDQDDKGNVHLLSEDESFCLLAGNMGMKLAVHPSVNVPHLKPKPIQPGIQAKIEMGDSEVIAQGYQEETGELKPEEVPT